MKKLLAAVAVGAFVFGGFLFMDKPAETASELEPPIFKMQSSVEVM